MSLFDQAMLLGPALLAGLLIVLTHVPLGLEVLKRRIVFMDLAVAQAAALGFMLGSAAAMRLGVDASHGHVQSDSFAQMLFLQLWPLSFALAAVIFFRWIEKVMPAQQEAVIGSSYVVAASLMAVLAARMPQGSEAAQSLLSGQILFVS